MFRPFALFLLLSIRKRASSNHQCKKLVCNIIYTYLFHIETDCLGGTLVIPLVFSKDEESRNATETTSPLLKVTIIYPIPDRRCGNDHSLFFFVRNVSETPSPLPPNHRAPYLLSHPILDICSARQHHRSQITGSLRRRAKSSLKIGTDVPGTV